MDIKRQFALNAIAAAILTLHTEAASAASCPAQIVGTFLSGVICDFDSTTGSSVTVTNAAEVGGIAMNGYNPSSPSKIVIDAGGSVVGTPGGIGIAINSSSLSNGLTNNGTISSTNTGISITSASTINGGLSNNGLISTQNIGISINHSTVNDSISNTGTINATTGTGIFITASSTINGGITNSGTITSGGVFVGLVVNNNSIINGGISNNGLIEATGSGDGILVRSSSTINGGITNTGTIRSTNKSGIGITNLSHVTGDIFNSGIISGGDQALAIHNASILNGNIINNGTINGGNRGLAIFSATTVSGSISNSGTITGGNTGLVVSSSSTITGGISNSGTIQGNSFGIRVAADSSLSNIDLIGRKARIIGAVDAPNTDVNITSGAEFTSEGTFNVNNFNIASNATFNMANAMTANAVNNSGTLAVGSGLQTITGNYTQNTGGVFQIGASSATNYGKLAVTGTVDMSASGNVNVQVAQNSSMHNGDVLTDVITGGVYVGPTGAYNVTDNSFIWKFTATNNLSNTGINLTATIDSNAYNACRGSYCQGAANVIIGQVGVGNSVFSPFGALATQSEFTNAASQATPELNNENVQVTQLATRSVMDIVPMWSAVHGASAGDAMVYQPDKIWLKPYAATMIQDAINSVPGYHASVYGIVMGKDIQLPENWLLGGAFALGKDNIRGKAILSGQSIDSDVYQGIVYAAKKLPHNLYVAGQGLLGYGRNDSSRSLPLFASTASASYNSWFSNLRAQLGWNYFAMKDLVLTPEVDASYLFVNQEGYQESGSPLGLKVASNNNSFLVLGAYGNAAYHLATFRNQQDLALSGYAGFAHNVLNTQPQATSTFIAGGPSFSTYGVEFNKTVFRSGIGLTLANPCKPLKMNVSYDMQTGNNAYSGIGSITITYKI